MKNFVSVLFLAFVIVSCAEAPKTSEKTTEPEAVVITVGNFNEKAGDLVGKLVTISGTADHICRSDGKKLFLISTEEEGRVKVTTGENMAAFNSENEGQDIIVTGIVEESVVDEAYLQEWEEEILAGIEETKHLGGGEPMTEEEKAAGHHEEEAGKEQIANYRLLMKDRGVDKLSFYSITCTAYEIVKE